MALVSRILQPTRVVANDIGVMEFHQGPDLPKSFPEAEEQKEAEWWAPRLLRAKVHSLVAAHDLHSHVLVQQLVSGLVNMTKGSTGQKMDGVEF